MYFLCSIRRKKSNLSILSLQERGEDAAAVPVGGLGKHLQVRRGDTRRQRVPRAATTLQGQQ